MSSSSGSRNALNSASSSPPQKSLSPQNIPAASSGKRVVFKDVPRSGSRSGRSGSGDSFNVGHGDGSSVELDSPGRAPSDHGSLSEPISVLHEMDDIDADFQYADIGFVEMEADEVVARRIQHEFGRYDSFVSTDDNNNCDTSRTRTTSAGDNASIDTGSLDEGDDVSAAVTTRPNFDIRNSKSPPTIMMLKSRSDTDLAHIADNFEEIAAQLGIAVPVQKASASPLVVIKTSASNEDLKSTKNSLSVSPSGQLTRIGSSCTDLHSDSITLQQLASSSADVHVHSQPLTATVRRSRSLFTPSSSQTTAATAAAIGRVRASSDVDHPGLEASDNDALNSETMNPKVRSVGACLWPYVRHQVFLGIAASSVPIKPDVSDLREDLTNSGVRFVYFSPRNMRRSKPVAEKIGIQFDWNCAISLRDLDLDSGEALDPHRAIRYSIAPPRI